MGGNSTSNGAALGGNMEKIRSFDLLSWQGLTEVLSVGRESMRDDRVYADFRNLVLDYAQKGGDEALKAQLQSIVSGFKAPTSRPSTEVKSARDIIAPTPTESPKQFDDVDLKIDMLPRRLEPSFIPHAMLERERANIVPENLPVHTESENIVELDAVSEVHQDEVSEVSVPDTVEVIEPEPQVITEEAATEVVATIAPEVSVEEIPQAPKSMEEHKARIAEIKRSVHEHVGNPAAIIDTQNEAGKKYMLALLTALKATSAGSPVGIESAMTSLEEAYKNVIGVTDSKDTASEQVLNASVSAEPVADVSFRAPEILAHPDIEVSAFANHTEEKSDVSEHDIEVEEDANDDELQDEEKLPAVEGDPVVPEVVDIQPEPEVVLAETATFTQESVKETPVWQNNKYTQKDLELKRQVDLLDIRSKLAAEKTVHQSELSTPEISKSLDALLHEWSIFTGSGILGIGPGGVEHPLYQKLSGLSMGEVLSGRWEKANPKVVKMIKEYVDAWRHEQGIAYTINETFEHYLRRVVQRILKRQTQ